VEGAQLLKPAVRDRLRQIGAAAPRAGEAAPIDGFEQGAVLAFEAKSHTDLRLVVGFTHQW
jgi:hypothetical protein